MSKSWLLAAPLVLLAACSTTARVASTDDVLVISPCTTPEPEPEEDAEGCAKRTAGTPLTISGTPVDTVASGSAYSF